jgi:pimeloyl-ACP methyl ester carboxylesterase
VQRAWSRPGRSGHVKVDGVRLHYLGWNADEQHKPPLILVHGYRAHAHWWDCIAPYFTDDFRVFALDLSGMGDSEHRDHYDAKVFARDVVGFIDQLGLAPATLVGHSFGGGRVLRACAERPSSVGHIVIIDSYVQFKGEPVPDVPVPSREARPGLSKEVLIDRFRLSPPQPTALRFLRDHVARHSVRRVDGGWDWKFDRRMPSKITETQGQEVLAKIDVPVDVIIGEHSEVVDWARAARTVAALPRGFGPIVVPEGHHHVLLTQPLALISTLRALFAIRHKRCSAEESV